jgi:hypothetical protein
VIEHEKTGILMQPNAGAEEFALAILQSLKAGKWNEWSVNARAKYESEFAPEVWKSKLFAAIEEAYR